MWDKVCLIETQTVIDFIVIGVIVIVIMTVISIIIFVFVVILVVTFLEEKAVVFGLPVTFRHLECVT